MSEHIITVALRAVPVPPEETLHVGDTVVYVTDPPDLPFRVVFDSSPFTGAEAIISDSQPHTLNRDGTFTCRCFITLENGQVVGWREDAPESGGEHDVRP